MDNAGSIRAVLYALGANFGIFVAKCIAAVMTGSSAMLAEAIEGGPLDAPIADAKLHKMEHADYAPEFPLQWALKDVDLAIGAAPGAALPLLAALSRQWRSIVDAGHGRHVGATADVDEDPLCRQPLRADADLARRLEPRVPGVDRAALERAQGALDALL